MSRKNMQNRKEDGRFYCALRMFSCCVYNNYVRLVKMRFSVQKEQNVKKPHALHIFEKNMQKRIKYSKNSQNFIDRERCLCYYRTIKDYIESHDRGASCKE